MDENKAPPIQAHAVLQVLPAAHRVDCLVLAHLCGPQHAGVKGVGASCTSLRHKVLSTARKFTLLTVHLSLNPEISLNQEFQGALCFVLCVCVCVCVAMATLNNTSMCSITYMY